MLQLDSKGVILNDATFKAANSADYVQKAVKVVTMVDLAGHERYFKTTAYGLTGHLPDYACLIISANNGTALIIWADVLVEFWEPKFLYGYEWAVHHIVDKIYRTMTCEPLCPTIAEKYSPYWSDFALLMDLDCHTRRHADDAPYNQPKLILSDRLPLNTY